MSKAETNIARLMNTCASCGAEESLDSLIGRMIDDAEVRRCIHDVLTISLPLGRDVLRYLRLHKPQHQRLRMDKVRALLGTLLADMRRGAIERNGRDWQVSVEDWRGAFAALFARADKGGIKPPLTGHAYLYAILAGEANSAEAQAEREHEQALRTAPRTSTQSMTVAQALAPQPAPAPQPKPGTSPLVQKIKAEIEAKRALRAVQPEEGGSDE